MELKKKAKSESDEIWVNKFDEESAQEFREAIQDAGKGDPLKPITVYIDSYGGQVDALAKMIETMDETPNPIITVAMGKAMSCGAMLLSHGDIRFCGRHSRVMVHEVSSGTVGDVHDMVADVAETKRLNRYFMGMLARNCSIKGGYDALRKRIKQQDGRDRFLDAAAALEFGIVDAIGLPAVATKIVHAVSMTPPKTKQLRPAQKHKKTKSDTKKR